MTCKVAAAGKRLLLFKKKIYSKNYIFVSVYFEIPNTKKGCEFKKKKYMYVLEVAVTLKNKETLP